MLKLRTNLPTEYDETYVMNAKEQTIVIELSFVNGFILDQIRMPMVKDMLGGDVLVECFQRCLSACIYTLMQADLLTEEFYKEHEDILDEQHGIRDGVVLDTMGVSDLSCDVSYLISQYLTILGHDLRVKPKKDELYGKAKYFLPYRD